MTPCQQSYTLVGVRKAAAEENGGGAGMGRQRPGEQRGSEPHFGRWVIVGSPNQMR